MEDVNFKGDFKNPNFTINYSNAEISICGRSTPEDANSIYNPIIKAISKFTESNEKDITLNVKLEYINSTSTKYLVQILINLKNRIKPPQKFIVNWYYYDEEQFEYAKDFSEVSKIQFRFIDYISK